MSEYDEEAMLAAMGLPTGFGKKPKQVNQARVDHAIEETRRKDPPAQTATPKSSLPARSTQSSVGTSKTTPDTPTPMEGVEEPEGKPSAPADDSDSDMSDDEEEEELADIIPITHQAALRDHARVYMKTLKCYEFLPCQLTLCEQTVAALSVDPAGARVVSGGRDCLIKLWDFHGMDANMRPFRSLEPAEGNPVSYHPSPSSNTTNSLRLIIPQVRDLQFSLSGDQIIVATTTTQAKIYDRDGLEMWVRVAT